MKALVTGAAGFVGKNLVDGLLSAGDDVVCQVHSEVEALAFRRRGLATAVGDLRDAGALRDDAWKGVDTVYHLASVVAPYSRELTFAVNVEATRRLAEIASRRPTPPTFVFVSSLSAAGPCVDDEPRREEGDARPVSWYGESKLAAEAALAELADALPITVVRPPSVFGFWDVNLLAMYKSVRRGWNIIGVSRRFRYSFLHVSDLVTGLMAAARQGRRLAPWHGLPARDSLGQDAPATFQAKSAQPGIYYLCDERDVTFEQLGILVAAALGASATGQSVKVRHVCVPAVLCWPLAACGSWYGRARRRKTFFNLDKMREAAAGSWVCSGALAARELGFSTARPLAERLQETERWYAQQGWL